MREDLKTYFRLAVRYNGDQAPRLIWGVLLAIVAQLCMLATPFITRFLIDDVIAGKSYEALVWVLIFSLAVLIVMFGTSLWSNYILYREFRKNGIRLRKDVFRSLQHAPLNFLGRTTSGEMSYRVLQDTDVVEESWSLYMVTIPYQCALLVGGALMLLWQWHLASFVFLLLILQVVVIVKFRTPLLRYATERKQQEQGVSGFTVERLAKIQLTRSLVAERRELRGFIRRLHQLIVISIRSFMLNKLGGATVTAVNNLWTFGILWYGGYNVIRGDMTLGSLMAFLLLSNILYQPVSSLTNLVLGFQNVRASVRRVVEYLELPRDVSDQPGASAYVPREGLITLCDVTYSYGVHTVLRNVNLSISPNSIVALVGRSGAGKTTLCRLIARQLDGYSGAINFDGRELRDYTVESVRRSVLFMMQGDFVMSGTLQDNLTLGRRGIPEADIECALRQTGLEAVYELPDRLQTLVGEGGLNISGGEAQRIALARALLCQPRILILDEPTSNVDAITEARIRDTLLHLKSTCTILLVAHRMSTVAIADVIAVLDGGSIAAVGTHQELLQTAVYRNIQEAVSRERGNA